MRNLLAFLFLVGLGLAASAQPATPTDVRGAASGMATRSVSNYLRLERGLLEALKARDRGTVRQALDDDFEFRSATASDGQAGAEWLDDELRNPVESAVVRDLSVREFGDVAVVSFLLDSRKSTKPKATASTLYVVDVWQQKSSKLLARYVAQPRRAPPAPTRPSGRE